MSMSLKLGLCVYSLRIQIDMYMCVFCAMKLCADDIEKGCKICAWRVDVRWCYPIYGYMYTHTQTHLNIITTIKCVQKKKCVLVWTSKPKRIAHTNHMVVDLKTRLTSLVPAFSTNHSYTTIHKQFYNTHIFYIWGHGWGNDDNGDQLPMWSSLWWWRRR